MLCRPLLLVFRPAVARRASLCLPAADEAHWYVCLVFSCIPQGSYPRLRVPWDSLPILPAHYRRRDKCRGIRGRPAFEREDHESAGAWPRVW